MKVCINLYAVQEPEIAPGILNRGTFIMVNEIFSRSVQDRESILGLVLELTHKMSGNRIIEVLVTISEATTLKLKVGSQRSNWLLCHPCLSVSKRLYPGHRVATGKS